MPNTGIISWIHKINQGSLCRQTSITPLALWNFQTGKHKGSLRPLPSKQSDTLGVIFYLRFVYPSSTICYKTEMCCVFSQSDIFADLARLIKTFCFLRDTLVWVIQEYLIIPLGQSQVIACTVSEHKGWFSTFTYHLLNNNFQLF